jgi:hypothetical protein
MKVGNLKLEPVYFFVKDCGSTEETYNTIEEADNRVLELKRANYNDDYGIFYGDIIQLGVFVKYTAFSVVKVKGDIDEAYIESKNMTELKKQFKSQIGSTKDVRLATFTNGEIKSVSKKTSTKKLVFVEKVSPKLIEEDDLNISSIIADGKTNFQIGSYNLLPDAKYIYKKSYYATDYSSGTILYDLEIYRVLERASSLEEIDEIVTKIQCDYNMRRKYEIEDEKEVSIMRVDTLKKYPIFYRDDKFYLDPKELIGRIRKRNKDTELMDGIVKDQYTNLKNNVLDEGAESPIKENPKDEIENRKEKIERLKRSLKGENYVTKDLIEKKNDRDLTMHSYSVDSILAGLLSSLIYKNKNSKEINYSLMRHIASILKQRDDELNDLKDDYMDNLVASIMKDIEAGILTEETKFHML